MAAATDARSGPGRFHAERLDVRGPALFGLFIMALFFGAGIGSAAFVPLDKGIAFSGNVIVESKVQAVQHRIGGLVAKLNVREGQEIKAGEVLITLDTSELDQQIATFKAQAEATRRQLQLIRQETQTYQDLLEKKLAARSKVLGLERQTAEVEKELAGLESKIVVAQQDRAKLDVRAPLAGKILTLSVHGPGSVIQAGATIAEIVPQDDRLVLEGKLTPLQIEHAEPGMNAKVWLRTLTFRDSRPFKAHLVWISGDSVEDKRTGVGYFVARVELEDSRSEIAKRIALHPGMRAEMLLLTGERTLLDQLLDPLVRNMHRAFRT